MKNIEIWIPAIAAVASIISIFLIIFFRFRDKNRKETNFLYKRMREFKTWCNNYSEILNKRRGLVFHNSAFSLSRSFVNQQDVTEAQIFLMDTIMTSKKLSYSSIYNENKEWVNVKYNRNISKKFVNVLNKFGNNLFNIAIQLQNKNGENYFINSPNDINFQEILIKFEDLINNFKYVIFYKLLKEII